MDDEELTEEQLYYKNKYLKYKLKYVILKEQLEQLGGVNKKEEKRKRKEKEKEEKKNFDPVKVKNYLEYTVKNKNNTLYNKIINNNILQAIKDNRSSSVKDAIVSVVSKKFKNENNKEDLQNYLINLINNYNYDKKIINLFESISIRSNNFNDLSDKYRPPYLGKDATSQHQDMEYLDLKNKIIKDNIIKKIKEELQTNVYQSLDQAIHKVLHNDINYIKLQKFILNICNKYYKELELKN